MFRMWILTQKEGKEGKEGVSFLLSLGARR